MSAECRFCATLGLLVRLHAHEYVSAPAGVLSSALQASFPSAVFQGTFSVDRRQVQVQAKLPVLPSFTRVLMC